MSGWDYSAWTTDELYDGLDSRDETIATLEARVRELTEERKRAFDTAWDEASYSSFLNHAESLSCREEAWAAFNGPTPNSGEDG